MKSSTSPIFTEIGKISGPFPLTKVSPENATLPLITTSIKPPFQPSPQESYSSKLKIPQEPATIAVVKDKGPAQVLISFALQAS